VLGAAFCAVALLGSADADARRKPKAAARAKAKAEPRSAADFLAKARRHYDALDYELVIEPADRVLGSADATIEQRLDAYTLQGSAFAIIGRTLDAEAAFRFLLRGRPAYELPEGTPPKILSVFRKVQLEEREISAQLAELERERLRKQMEISGGTTPEARGGSAVAFNFRVMDPGQVVSAVRVFYRRGGQGHFSSLPLEQGEDGRWSGAITGDWTASAVPYELQYYAAATGMGDVVWVSDGGPTTPKKLAIAAGEVHQARPFFAQPWFWGVTAGAAVLVGSAVGGAVFIATLPPASDLPVHRFK
jgi:hypothetical protein